MRRTLFFALTVLLLSPVQAWATLAVHDDVIVRRVQDNLGNNISFANGGGPFVATLYEDNRIVWQPGDPTSPTSGVNDVDLTYQGRQTTGNSLGTNWVGTDTTVIDEFYTFCAQKDITLSLNTRYDVSGLQSRTLMEQTVMTGYAAWVFDKFNKGIEAASIDPTLNTTANKNLMGVYQAAIWMGIVGWTDSNNDGIFQIYEPMDEVGGATAQLEANRETYSIGSGSNLRSLASAGIRYSDFLLDTSWTPGEYDSEYSMLRTWNNIQLINVQDGNSVDKQDLVIAYGGPLSIVPEPTSLAVWSLLAGGSAGLAVARRKRRQLGSQRWTREDRDSIAAFLDGHARHS